MTETFAGGIRCMTSPNIKTPHAFTTRFGGISSGVYESLNLGVTRGDDGIAVKQNYHKLFNALDVQGSKMVFSRQVHGNRVRVVTREDLRSPFSKDTEEADGLITNETDVPLIVFIADCVPILLHDPVLGVVATLHAGWRGTALNIPGIAVGKMTDTFGCRTENIRVAIGPSISQCCFETDSDVPKELEKTLGDDARVCCIERGRKFMVDLKLANRFHLLNAGITPENIDVSDECTFCLKDKYWSHRRTNGVRGSQVALIFLKG